MIRPVSVLGTLVLAVLTACASAPKTKSEAESLQASAQSTIQAMQAKDPGLRQVLDRSSGYAVFPSIGKGGFMVGAAYGKGVLYERGQPVGYVTLNQGSFGAQIGGQTYSEIIVLSTPTAVQRMKGGNFSIGGDLSAVVLTAGAAASAQFQNGVAVLVMPKGGVMAGITVTGQQINYQPGSPPPPPQPAAG